MRKIQEYMDRAGYGMVFDDAPELEGVDRMVYGCFRAAFRIGVAGVAGALVLRELPRIWRGRNDSGWDAFYEEYYEGDE